jgi:hypothetical protein
MTDMPDKNARFDEDRLLAFALGLEDDAELESVLADDEDLRRRLEAQKADVDDVGAGLQRLVPAPDDDYADPASARWDGLRPFFTPPPERRPSRGRWRVLVPALGAILAVAVVGALALRSGPLDSQMAGDRGAESADSLGAPTAETDASKATYGAGALAADLELFRTAFVARAGEVQGTTQRFTVVRRIKGVVTDDIYLEVVDEPIAEETLALVLLGPVTAGDEGATPVPAPTAPEDLALQRLGLAGFVAFGYQGAEAVARPLPADVDLDQFLP